MVEDGAVTGVVVWQNGARAAGRAPATVLAADGFAATGQLIARVLPDLGDPFYGGVSPPRPATPSGLGARLGARGSATWAPACGHGLVVLGHGTRVSPALPFIGAVLVDADGERFVDEEATGYSRLAGVLRGQPGERAVMIWDAEAHGSHPRVGDDARMPRGRAPSTTVPTWPPRRRRARPSSGGRAGARSPARSPGLTAPFHFAW